MINIEQIEKEWEAYCEKYGFKGRAEFIPDPFIDSKPIITDIFLTVWEQSNLNSGRDYVMINLILNEITLRVESKNNSNKLFTSFYEKLTKEQEND